MRYTKLVTTMIIFLVVASCGPIIQVPTTPPKPTMPSDFQWIIGASLEAQVVGHGITEGDAYEWVVEAGAGVVGMSNQIDWAIGSHPTSLTFASIIDNNALTPEGVGWNYTDEQRYEAKFALMAPDTELRVVAPWWVGEPWPGAQASLEHARAWIFSIQRTNLCIIDWKPYAEANPAEFADFVHMATPAAIEARYQMLTQPTCS